MIINPYSFGIPIDSDAQSFLTAAGITDSTITTAIDTLVKTLKSNGTWTKMKAIYPFVGGTASTHKFNLKDPIDLNAAFRLVFSGGFTHSANGILPNGINGLADTFLVPNAVLIGDNTHISYYSRTNILANQAEFGILASNSVERISMTVSYSGTFTADQYLFTTGRVSGTNSNSTGFYLSSRTNSTTHKAFKNGVQIGSTNTGASGVFNLLTSSIKIFCFNNGFYSTKECAFASIGDGLTDTEAANLYTAVQNFQTALNRQV